MNIKTLLIMGLLSFGVGGCSNAQNKQGNSNVKELSKEQKEDLKKMYEMYQYFKMKPGIPENANVKERTELLPWVEMEKEFDWSHVKDWLSNARLEFSEYYKINGWLLLHGKYVPEKNSSVNEEYLQSANEDGSAEKHYVQKVAPIRMFGNMRANLISYLLSADGDTLGFSKNITRLKISDDGQELALHFKPACDDSADFKGGAIEVELLPPLRWKHARISLLPEDEGKEYEFDGIRFKVFKSNPGDVILEYDEKYAKQIAKLKLILIKGQKLIDRCRQFTSGGKKILQSYKFPDMGFGEWCVTFLGENSESLGMTPEALKLATKEHYQPTSEELRHFHETAGEIVGHQLTDILVNINPQNYKEFYQQWVEKGYEAAVKSKDTDSDAIDYYNGNDGMPYIGFLRGVSIGSSYVKANLKPDWDIINRCAIDFLDKYNSADEDSLYSIVQKHTEEYIDPIVTRREILSFLTDKDIKYLSKEVVQDDSPNMYCWYKTNTEADAMYIYMPEDSTSNKPLIKVRYQLGGDKPEIIFPE